MTQWDSIFLLNYQLDADFQRLIKLAGAHAGVCCHKLLITVTVSFYRALVPGPASCAIKFNLTKQNLC